MFGKVTPITIKNNRLAVNQFDGKFSDEGWVIYRH
tara:strand:+ start:7071 stop:7175 length:105 start_codon:yes stop_codon:yes gene_type:complete